MAKSPSLMMAKHTCAAFNVNCGKVRSDRLALIRKKPLGQTVLYRSPGNVCTTFKLEH